MSNHESIYAKFVAANPVPDPEKLSATPTTAQAELRLIVPDSSADEVEVIDLFSDAGSPRRGHLTRRVALAAGLVLLIGAAVLTRASEPDLDAAASPDPITPTEQATAFLARFEAGDLDGAIDLLSDPLGSVWFISIGPVNRTEQIRDYLEFAQAVGVEAELIECNTETIGPSTLVICEANQQTTALLPLDLRFPTFDMTFEVWDDGIRKIDFIEHLLGDFDAAFDDSRFFEFASAELAPRGLLQSGGDPVWSRENGELVRGLVAGFLATDS